MLVNKELFGIWMFIPYMTWATKLVPYHNQSKLEIVEGGVVFLPCQTRPPTADDRAHLVLWYKGESGKPIYSYDARNKTKHNAQHWSDNDVLGDRANFHTDDSLPSHLVLENVQENDAGEYKCRVDYDLSPTRNHFVMLTVIVPTKKVIILDQKGNQLLSSVIGPFREGSTLALTCVAIGGHPPPRVSWWHDTALVDDSFEPGERDGVVRNHLNIFSLTRDDLLNRLVCQATNTKLTVPIQRAVTIDMNFLPVHVSILEPRFPLSANIQHNITCQAVGARPPAVITWWTRKNTTTKKLRSYRENVSRDGNITYSVLYFTPSVEDVGEILVCRAENPIVAHSSIEDTWVLDIRYKPMPEITVLNVSSNTTALTLMEGNSLTIDCKVSANPPPFSIKWIHNNTVLSVNGKETSLNVKALTPSHAGFYACEANNAEGEGRSTSVLIIIEMLLPPNLINCIIINRTMTSLRVSCVIPNNLISSSYVFVMEVYDVATKELVVNTTNEKSPLFNATNLLPGHGYSIIMYTTNARGQSQKTVIYAVTSLPQTIGNTTAFVSGHVSSSTRKFPLLPLTPLLGVIVGVAASLMLIAIIIVIVLRLRIPGSRDRQQNSRKNKDSPTRINKGCGTPLKDNSECGTITPTKKDSADTLITNDCITESDHKSSKELVYLIRPREVSANPNKYSSCHQINRPNTNGGLIHTKNLCNKAGSMQMFPMVNSECHVDKNTYIATPINNRFSLASDAFLYPDARRKYSFAETGTQTPNTMTCNTLSSHEEEKCTTPLIHRRGVNGGLPPISVSMNAPLLKPNVPAAMHATHF